MDIVLCGWMLLFWFFIGSVGNALDRSGITGYDKVTYDTQQQVEEGDDSIFYTSMWLSMEGD